MMIQNSRTHRIFGPKIRRRTWYSTPIQRGQGLGSFLAKMGRKLLPLAKKTMPIISKGIKKVAKSQTVQDIGKTILERGSDAAAELAANAILGTPKEDNLSLAQERLQSARQDIAKIIRSAPKRVLSESDNSDIEIEPPIKKRRAKVKKKNNNSRSKQKYNLLKNIT